VTITESRFSGTAPSCRTMSLLCPYSLLPTAAVLVALIGRTVTQSTLSPAPPTTTLASGVQTCYSCSYAGPGQGSAACADPFSNSSASTLPTCTGAYCIKQLNVTGPPFYNRTCGNGAPPSTGCQWSYGGNGILKTWNCYCVSSLCNVAAHFHAGVTSLILLALLGSTPAAATLSALLYDLVSTTPFLPRY
jgi:hypothetical protein